MAFIPPTAGTTVVLYSGIPADPSYENVLMFSNEAAQRAFFDSKMPVATFTDFSYIDGTQEIRVPANRESLYNVNYIAYRNSNYGSKWFYAFVTRLEYYSANSTAIFFEADEWATWQFSLKYYPCFIEREHALGDAIGANLLPENFETGERVVAQQTIPISDYNSLGWFVWVSERIQIAGIDWYDATLLNGTYLTGAYYADISSNPAQKLQWICDAYATEGKLSEILAVFSSVSPSSAGYIYTGNEIPQRPDSIDGYSPKNNKLFTYPYCYLSVFTAGSSAVYRYEYFTGHTTSGNIQFTQTVPALPNPTGILYPLNYRGCTADYESGLPINGYPMGAANVNSFANYLTQNALGITISGIGGVANTVLGAANGNASGAVNGIMQIANTINQVYQEWLTPRSVKGTASCGNALAQDTKLVPIFKSMTIKAEFARIIDDYFSMYGYAVHETLVPNLTHRANWNFVKTINANITGNCPVTSLNTIKSAFNNGITLWHNGTFDYGDMSNPII